MDTSSFRAPPPPLNALVLTIGSVKGLTLRGHTRLNALVSATLHDTGAWKAKAHTEIIVCSGDATFDEHLEFNVTDMSARLTVSVLHKTRIGTHDLIGSVDVILKDVLSIRAPQWWRLRRRANDEKYRGEVLLTFGFHNRGPATMGHGFGLSASSASLATANKTSALAVIKRKMKKLGGGGGHGGIGSRRQSVDAMSVSGISVNTYQEDDDEDDHLSSLERIRSGAVGGRNSFVEDSWVTARQEVSPVTNTRQTSTAVLPPPPPPSTATAQASASGTSILTASSIKSTVLSAFRSPANNNASVGGAVSWHDVATPVTANAPVAAEAVRGHSVNDYGTAGGGARASASVGDVNSSRPSSMASSGFGSMGGGGSWRRSDPPPSKSATLAAIPPSSNSTSDAMLRNERYSAMSRQDLLTEIDKLRVELVVKNGRVSDLETYVDQLTTRVMESHPELLCATPPPRAGATANKRRMFLF